LAVDFTLKPRIFVLTLGAEPVLSEAEGGHPCSGMNYFSLPRPRPACYAY